MPRSLLGAVEELRLLCTFQRDGRQRALKRGAVALASLHLLAWTLACGFSGGDEEEERTDIREILPDGPLDYPTPARGFSSELTWSELRATAPGLFEDGDRTTLPGLTLEPSRFPSGVVPDSRPNAVHVRGLDESFIALATERYGPPRAYAEGDYDFWSWVNPANHVMLEASSGYGTLDVSFKPYLDLETCVGARGDPLGFMGEAWIGVSIDELRQRNAGRMTERAAGRTSGSEVLYSPPCYPWTGHQEWSLTFGYDEPGVVTAASTVLHYRGEEEQGRLLELLRARFDEQPNISTTVNTIMFVPGDDSFEARYTDETITNGYQVSIGPRRERPGYR